MVYSRWGYRSVGVSLRYHSGDAPSHVMYLLPGRHFCNKLLNHTEFALEGGDIVLEIGVVVYLFGLTIATM